MPEPTKVVFGRAKTETPTSGLNNFARKLDSKSVVDSSTVPHTKVHKCHNALSFHCVREVIATAIIGSTTLMVMRILLISSASIGVKDRSQSYFNFFFLERGHQEN